MTRDEFTQGMRELTDVFGDKWTAPIMSRLFIRLRLLDGKLFSVLMQNLAFSTSRWPSAGDIVTACHGPLLGAIERDRNSQLEALRSSFPCRQCENSGWIFCIKPPHPAEYAFQCGRCSTASIMKVSSDVPVWEPSRFPGFAVKRYSPPVKSAAPDRDEIRSLLSTLDSRNDYRQGCQE